MAGYEFPVAFFHRSRHLSCERVPSPLVLPKRRGGSRPEPQVPEVFRPSPLDSVSEINHMWVELDRCPYRFVKIVTR
jgi:hypothetical protein